MKLDAFPVLGLRVCHIGVNLTEMILTSGHTAL